jgi:hypothetical protein
MKILGTILGLLCLGGCCGKADYSAYADGRRTTLSRIASLDARLCGLMGEKHPDSTRLLRILDTLRLKSPRSGSATDTASKDAVARTLSEIGIEPVLHPNDSDLVPSLAWTRRNAGCVPLVLFWLECLRNSGHDAQSVLLPGHIAISMGEQQWIETLRKGILRSKPFYDSAFLLGQRPYYRNLKPDSNAVLASMLVQAGILEWRRDRTRNAESAFRAATKICPGLPEAEGNLGLVLVELDRKHDASRHLAIALKGDALAEKTALQLTRLQVRQEKQ